MCQSQFFPPSYSPCWTLWILTRHDEDVSVLVSVVGSVTSGAVSDGEARRLVTDQLKTGTIV